MRRKVYALSVRQLRRSVLAGPETAGPKRGDKRRQQYKAALVDTRSEFIKTAVIGILIGTLTMVQMKNSITFNASAVGIFLFMFCIPFGWKFVTYLQSFLPLSIFGTWLFWLIYAMIKLCLSVVIGIPAFIYQLVKTILTQRKINKMK